MAVARSIATTDEGADAPEQEQIRPTNAETVVPEPSDDPRSWTAAGVIETMRGWRRGFPDADVLSRPEAAAAGARPAA
jgi:hypothetical protein